MVQRVVHVELVVGAVVGVKGQTQQSLFLSVEVRQALDVQKISGLQGAVFQDANGSALFHDEEAVVARRPFIVRPDC